MTDQNVEANLEAIELAVRRASNKVSFPVKSSLLLVADELAKMVRERQRDRQPTKPQSIAEQTAYMFGSYGQVEEFIDDMRAAAVAKWPEEACLYLHSHRDE